MNNFDFKFFSKYVPKWHEIQKVVHAHPITILLSLLTKIWVLVVVPVIFYYYSARIQDIIPFMYLEIYLIIIYIKLIYDVFDWYNDVWIITNEWVISLERSFLKSNSDSINYDKIEWVWVDQSWLTDKIFQKWNLQIHKIWDAPIELYWAMQPYKAMDLIEKLSNEKLDWNENERFDLIMDALSWVVWEYIHDSKTNEKKKVEKKDIKEKIRQIEGTIDLSNEE